MLDNDVLAELEKVGSYLVETRSPAQTARVQTATVASITENLVFKFDNPVDYCEQVLKINTLTNEQKQIMQLVNKPPYKVLAPSGHSTGKTFLSACLANWWFDTFPHSIVLTTAPSERQVKNLLWKEIRVQRARAGLGGFIGPREPRLDGAHEDHYALGFTARDSNSFQGHHSPYMLIIFDESQGIHSDFWDAYRGMLTGIKWAFVGIYNPVGQGCRVFKEEGSPSYHPVVRLSCIDHPNITAELAGLPPPIPGAIHLAELKSMLQDWATPIEAHDASPTDVFLDGQWWHPGPIADARILGRWPLMAVNSVWSLGLFDDCRKRRIVDAGRLQIGCDVARYGDDNTAIHVRKGFVSLHHEWHNGWGTTQTARRLMDLTNEYANKYKGEKIYPKEIPVAVDDCGVGGGVTDRGREDGHLFVQVNASWCVEALEDKFDSLRSALWFGVKDQAEQGHLSLAKLDGHVVERLKEQLCIQKYELDTRARRVAWSKKKMKDLTGDHSPDDADAFNLAYLSLDHLREYQTGRIWVPT